MAREAEKIKLALDENKIYKYDEHKKVSFRFLSKTETEMAVCAVFNDLSEENNPPRLSLSDIHVAYMIAKYDWLNLSEIKRAVQLRKDKLKNAIITTDVESALVRLMNYGMIAEYKLKSDNENDVRRLYSITASGREIVNNAMSKKLKDLSLNWAYKTPNEIIGSSASSYVALNFVSRGASIGDNKIKKIACGVERYPNIMYINKCEVAIEPLYFNYDTSIMTDEEYEQYVERKIVRIMDFAKSSDSARVIAVCNSYQDMNVFFRGICQSKLDIYHDYINRVAFTSSGCITNEKVNGVAFIATDSIYYEENRYIPSAFTYKTSNELF